MSVANLVQQAAADGVTLSLDPSGGIKYVGSKSAVAIWLPIIKEHKPGIVSALQGAANEPRTFDREAFEERAAIREYDGRYSREAAELLAAWEMAQALFTRLTAREWLARYAPDRLPAGDKPENYPVAQIRAGNDFWLKHQRRRGER